MKKPADMLQDTLSEKELGILLQATLGEWLRKWDDKLKAEGVQTVFISADGGRQTRRLEFHDFKNGRYYLPLRYPLRGSFKALDGYEQPAPSCREFELADQGEDKNGDLIAVFRECR